MRALNRKNLWLFGGLLLAGLAVNVGLEYVQLAVRTVLTSRWTRTSVWVLVIALFVLQKLTSMNSADGYGPDDAWSRMVKFFHGCWSLVSDITTHGLGAATSLTLMKGCYLQIFESQRFFLEFSAYDLFTLGLVSSAAFIYVAYKLVLMGRDLLFQNTIAENHTPQILTPQPIVGEMVGIATVASGPSPLAPPADPTL